MNLFIIGNGFDLAHGLSTRYEDFRQYVLKIDPSFHDRIFNIYEGAFPRYYRNPLDDVLIDPHTKKEIDESSKLWSDIEKHMSYVNDNIILSIDSNLGLEYICEQDDVYTDTFNEYLAEIFSDVKEKLEEYLKKWISKVSTKNITKRTSKILSQEDENEELDLFLTFNYTNLLEDSYNIESTQILHIHGEVSKTPLIIGHNNYKKIEELERELSDLNDRRWGGEDEDGIPIENDESNEEIVERLKLEHLKNYYEETIKNTEECLSDNKYFFNWINSVQNIYVIGHGFGNVDIPYFEKIVKSTNKNVKWHIYYYGEKEAEEYKKKAKDLGIEESNLFILPSSEFFDI